MATLNLPTESVSSSARRSSRAGFAQLSLAALGLALCWSSLAPLSAQDAPSAPVDLIPPDALVAIGWRGADALEPAFDKTALGEILAEPRLKSMCESLGPAIESLLRENIHDAEEREELLLLREAATLLWTKPVALGISGIGMANG